MESTVDQYLCVPHKEHNIFGMCALKASVDTKVQIDLANIESITIENTSVD